MSDKKMSKARRPVPVSMPAELEARIEETSTLVKLSKQDVMRLSMERGIDVLIAQLTGTTVGSAT
jgi:hypothetical protein